MSTFQELARVARRLAADRGHRLGRITKHWHRDHVADAQCDLCSEALVLNCKPGPTETHLSGPVLALNCKAKIIL